MGVFSVCPRKARPTVRKVDRAVTAALAFTARIRCISGQFRLSCFTSRPTELNDRPTLRLCVALSVFVNHLVGEQRKSLSGFLDPFITARITPISIHRFALQPDLP